MSPPASLVAKIRRLSVRPSGGAVEPTSGEIVVLVLAPERVAAAFDAAHGHLASGRRVRLVGPGVTLRRTWPSWVSSQPELILTEHGAFNHDAYVVTTLALQAKLRAWLDEVFSGAFESAAGQVLFTSACARFLQTAIATYAVARSLTTALPGATFVCLDQGFHTINGGWDTRLFEDLVERTGGTVSWEGPAPRRARRGAWAARTAVVGGVALAGALWHQLREYGGARRSRAELGRLQDGASPDTWLTMIPDWPRANAIAADAFALPLLRQGSRIGILLVSSLRPGTRDETDLKHNRVSDELWPGLGALPRGEVAIDQAVMPSSPGALARALVAGARASAVALARLAAGKPEVRVGDALLDLSAYTWPLVSLATLDVLRGKLAEAATSDLVARRDFRGRTVVVSCSSTVSFAAADLGLQRAGATTLNNPDGSGSDMWTGVGSTVSTARCVWTVADARSVGESCPNVVVAGMPVRVRLPRRDRPPRRVLLLNNHGHREFFAGGVFRERAFQEELLAIVDALRARGRDDLEFRWRPHPAAAKASIDEGMRQVSRLALSTGAALEEDAAWADLIVCGYSTSIIELTFAGVPVFVQARSEMLGLPALDFVTEERLFWSADEGAVKVLACLSKLERGDADVLDAERAARAALFGPDGEPQGAREALAFARRLATDAATARRPVSQQNGNGGGLGNEVLALPREMVN